MLNVLAHQATTHGVDALQMSYCFMKVFYHRVFSLNFHTCLVEFVHSVSGPFDLFSSLFDHSVDDFFGKTVFEI
jgi:hypothetical protein